MCFRDRDTAYGEKPARPAKRRHGHAPGNTGAIGTFYILTARLRLVAIFIIVAKFHEDGSDIKHKVFHPIVSSPTDSSEQEQALLLVMEVLLPLLLELLLPLVLRAVAAEAVEGAVEVVEVDARLATSYDGQVVQRCIRSSQA